MQFISWQCQYVHAPHIVSLSALERFSGTNEKKYQGYTQQKYDGFVANPNENTYNAFKNEIKKLEEVTDEH